MECNCFSCLQDIEISESRNKICSIVAGALFSIGWWCAIDASVTDPNNIKPIYHLCGVFGCISMFMINNASNGQLRGDAYTDGLLGGIAAKVWFFLGCLMGFGAMLGSFVIFFGDYISSDQYSSAVPGVQLVLQNLGIMFGSLLYRFGRSEDIWG